MNVYLNIAVYIFAIYGFISFVRTMNQWFEFIWDYVSEKMK